MTLPHIPTSTLDTFSQISQLLEGLPETATAGAISPDVSDLYVDSDEDFPLLSSSKLAHVISFNCEFSMLPCLL